MTYQIAEKFKSIQGEGLHAGTPTAFIRFVGCSVGKRICQHCDTDFDNTMPWRGGGTFTVDELLEWAEPYDHVCLTGGEPLDQDLAPLLECPRPGRIFHLETSGTKPLLPLLGLTDPMLFEEMNADRQYPHLWICVSPKPGYLESVVMSADEVKVIAPGLGNGDGWPTLKDALRWADAGQLVYLQPRNGKFIVDTFNQRQVLNVLQQHPNLRLSTQMHKVLNVE